MKIIKETKAIKIRDKYISYLICEDDTYPDGIDSLGYDCALVLNEEFSYNLDILKKLGGATRVWEKGQVTEKEIKMIFGRKVFKRNLFYDPDDAWNICLAAGKTKASRGIGEVFAPYLSKLRNYISDINQKDWYFLCECSRTLDGECELSYRSRGYSDVSSAYKKAQEMLSVKIELEKKLLTSEIKQQTINI